MAFPLAFPLQKLSEYADKGILTPDISNLIVYQRLNSYELPNIYHFLTLSQMILAMIYNKLHQSPADKGHNGEDHLQCHGVSQSRKGDSKPKPQVQSVSKHVPAHGRKLPPP